MIKFVLILSFLLFSTIVCFERKVSNHTDKDIVNIQFYLVGPNRLIYTFHKDTFKDYMKPFYGSAFGKDNMLDTFTNTMESYFSSTLVDSDLRFSNDDAHALSLAIFYKIETIEKKIKDNEDKFDWFTIVVFKFSDYHDVDKASFEIKTSSGPGKVDYNFRRNKE